MTTLKSGHPACISIMLYDGLVLARSAFNHAMNYRSVMIFGKAKTIEGNDNKVQILKALSDKLVPGRWKYLRLPTENELNQTMILSFSLKVMTAKVRKGPPGDFQKDMSHPVWAGEIPFELKRLEPIADPKLSTEISLPKYLKNT